MSDKKKKIKTAILSLLLFVLLFTAGCGKTLPEKVPDLRDDVSEYVAENIAKEPVAGENDMAVFNLLKSSSAPSEDYREKYLKSAEQFALELKDAKTINYETLAFTAMAVKEAGGNPEDLKGINLMDYLGDLKALRKAGYEAECYGIIAMKYCNKETKTLYKYDEDILNFMLSGDDYEGSLNEAEFRGLTLLAMSYYQTLPDVIVAIDGTLNMLKELQNEDGGFGDAVTDATVAAGLASISTDSYEFRKDDEGENLLSSLISYMDKDGFKKNMDGEIDEEATVKALTVLNMYKYKIVDEINFLLPGK